MATETEYKVPSAYVLAGMADCASPDSLDSMGAQFLTAVARATVESLEYEGDREDIPWTAADQCVPIYTFDVWRTFTDLAAWQEDPTEYGADGSDMEQAAKVCLFVIGERLAWAILEDMGSEDDDA